MFETVYWRQTHRNPAVSRFRIKSKGFGALDRQFPIQMAARTSSPSSRISQLRSTAPRWGIYPLQTPRFDVSTKDNQTVASCRPRITGLVKGARHAPIGVVKALPNETHFGVIHLTSVPPPSSCQPSRVRGLTHSAPSLPKQFRCRASRSLLSFRTTTVKSLTSCTCTARCWKRNTVTSAREFTPESQSSCLDVWIYFANVKP